MQQKSVVVAVVFTSFLNDLESHVTDEPICVFSESDVEVPQINCPKDIEVKTQEQQDSANVTWQVPTAKDNSGEKVIFVQMFAYSFKWMLKVLPMCVCDGQKNAIDTSLFINVSALRERRLISAEF